MGSCTSLETVGPTKVTAGKFILSINDPYIVVIKNDLKRL